MKSKYLATLMLLACLHSLPLHATMDLKAMAAKERILLSFVCFTWFSAVGSLIYEAYYMEKIQKPVIEIPS